MLHDGEERMAQCKEWYHESCENIGPQAVFKDDSTDCTVLPRYIAKGNTSRLNVYIAKGDISSVAAIYRERRYIAIKCLYRERRYIAISYSEINVHGRKQRYTEIKFRNEQRISIHLGISMKIIYCYS